MTQQEYFDQFIGDDPIEIHGVSVRELDLSTYTRNQLMRMGIKYVEQAIDAYNNPENILKQRYGRMFGPKRLIELGEALHKYGAL